MKKFGDPCSKLYQVVPFVLEHVVWQKLKMKQRG